MNQKWIPVDGGNLNLMNRDAKWGIGGCNNHPGGKCLLLFFCCFIIWRTSSEERKLPIHIWLRVPPPPIAEISVHYIANWWWWWGNVRQVMGSKTRMAEGCNQHGRVYLFSTSDCGFLNSTHSSSRPRAMMIIIAQQRLHYNMLIRRIWNKRKEQRFGGGRESARWWWW